MVESIPTGDGRGTMVIASIAWDWDSRPVQNLWSYGYMSTDVHRNSMNLQQELHHRVAVELVKKNQERAMGFTPLVLDDGPI